MKKKKSFRRKKIDPVPLASFVIVTAIFKIIISLVKAMARLNGDIEGFQYYNVEGMLSSVELIMTAIAFINSVLILKKSKVPTKRQKQLLYLWGIILIFVQSIYDITIILYDRLLTDVINFINTDVTKDVFDAYTSFYNSSHGFKYLGMFIAILLGMVATSIFLDDKELAIACIIIAIAFMSAFSFLKMMKVNIDILNINIGIVWTAVIFHSLQTIGLLIFGIYIQKKHAFKKELINVV